MADFSTGLKGVHPLLVQIVGGSVLVAMDATGWPMGIAEGVRTAERQAQHFAKGRTTVGPDVSPGRPLGRTVTNLDGTQRKSYHQAQADGLGRAVDCAFLIDRKTGQPSPEGSLDWEQDVDGDLKDDLPWRAYGEVAKAAAELILRGSGYWLVWGGDWRMADLPHLELRRA